MTPLSSRRIAPAPLLAVVLFFTALTTRAQSFTFVEAIFDESGPVDGLNFVVAAAASPDGKNLYACAGNGGLISSDNALVVFTRGADGKLTYLETHFDDDDSNNPGSADGLFSCRDVVVSADGKHVYTAAFSEGEIGIFTRSAATGALSFVSVVQDGVGVDGLAGVESLAMSPDGSTLFAAGSIDDALVAFSRNAATGALTFEDSAVEGVGGVSGLDRVLAVSVSPDGLHVYAAAGSNATLTGSDAVTAFSWNPSTGALSFVEAYFEGATQGAATIDGLDRVSSVVISPDGKHLYATGGLDVVSPQDLDWIALFARDASTGKLTWLSSIDEINFCSLDILFEFETYAAVHPGGDRLFVTSSRTALAEFQRDSVSGALSLVDSECFFDSAVDLGINLPKKLDIDPSGISIYVPGTASNAVALFDSRGIFTDGFESGNTAAWTANVP